MEREALSAALKREHREIDEGIGEFAAGLAWGGADATPLKRALEGLRRHIYLEEEFLFPPLRAVGLMAPVLVMLREHGEIWRTMDRLDAAAARGLADRSVRRLCAGLRGRLDRHSSKEEPMCYPQADRALTPEAASRLRGFLASGRLPEGWTCRQVRV